MTSAAIAEPSATIVTSTTSIETSVAEAEQSLRIGRVVASLQVLLASRRAARNEDHAHWYNISRGL